MEAVKVRFRELLERGEVEAVEASLRPGMQYVVQVRALSELGTEDAGRILERQLDRRLTEDQIEQSWYWIDLANGLRSLNRSQSLPYLLRRAEAAGENPLGHFFAAEAVCFLGFLGYLRQTETPLGRAALRLLHRALEGLRHGVPPQVVIEGRLGELVENLWDHRPRFDPLAVRVFHEALRLRRRAPHGEHVLAGEISEMEAFRWQMSRLAALEPLLGEYLTDVQADLRRALSRSDSALQRDIIQALLDLRMEAGEEILAVLSQGRFPHAALAVEALAWSRHAEVAPFLRNWVTQRLPLTRRTLRRQAQPPRRPSVPVEFPYEAILHALRGHPSTETEGLLLLAAHDWDPLYRTAAFSSLGWFEPYRQAEVLLHLQEGRRDPNPDAQTARAALARLGERQALQWFRQGLNAADLQRVHETIQLISQEGLILLWPDLDRLADADDLDVAHHAREALERLSEDLDGRRN